MEDKEVIGNMIKITDSSRSSSFPRELDEDACAFYAQGISEAKAQEA